MATVMFMSAYTETLKRIPHVIYTAMIRLEKGNSFPTLTKGSGY